MFLKANQREFYVSVCVEITRLFWLRLLNKAEYACWDLKQNIETIQLVKVYFQASQTLENTTEIDLLVNV